MTGETPGAAGAPVLVVRYAEIGLKGGNRRDFEKALAANLKYALRGLRHGAVERPRGRIVVRAPEDVERAAVAAARVFGVASVSPGLAAAADLAGIDRAAQEVMAAALATLPSPAAVPFRVTCRRSDKQFPSRSMELAARLGATLLAAFPRLKVNLAAPQLTLGVEIRRDEALVFCSRLQGPGGLPVGTTGRGVALLSGGIDSPVASWLGMKRGLRISFATYYSYPFVSEASLRKVEAIVKRLAEFQGGAALHVVPFADIQVAIKKQCPEALRTILYRRMMMRLAGRIAAKEGALALLTGESLGQVASQTLENMRCIGAAADLPVLRPVVGWDKSEITALARRIGTYEISIQPHPDCCTVFQPRKPRIRASLAEVEEAELALDVPALVDRAFSAAEVRAFGPG